MSIEDRDEDVEEEEEFHEVEEEKHKTSQESVGETNKDFSTQPTVTTNARLNNNKSPTSETQLPANDSCKEGEECSVETKVDLNAVEDESKTIVKKDDDIHLSSNVEVDGEIHQKDDPEHKVVANDEEPAIAEEAVGVANQDEESKVVDKRDSATDQGPTTVITTDPDESPAVGDIVDDRKLNSSDVGADLTEHAEVSTKQADTEQEESSSKNESSSPKPDVVAKNTDWTDIMLSSQGNDEKDSQEKTDGTTKKTEENPSKEEETNVVETEKKELDLDEDVKNPQYIPKKGVFYEHDDRSQDSENKKQSSTSVDKVAEPVSDAKENSNTRKPNTQENYKQNEPKRGNRRQRNEADRWNHDLFKDDKQKPKSKSELINAYGYDIRQERASRNNIDGRAQRSGSNNNATNINNDRQQDSQRTRNQAKDNRGSRQGQPTNRSRERRPRKSNNNMNTNTNTSNNANRSRNESTGASSVRRPPNVTNERHPRVEGKDVRQQQESTDVKQNFPIAQNLHQVIPASTSRRDNQEGGNYVRDRFARNTEVRTRRQNSKDRPAVSSNEDKLPPINTVMPPITIWSNKIEDMVKEEATRKESSPSRHHQQQQQSSMSKGRSNDYWPQNQPNKAVYHDRPLRNIEDGRHQQQQHHYVPRRPYQEREENSHNKPTQFMNRNQYADRSNQQHHQEWRRTNQFNSYAKTGEFEPIKTQTFENSRLNQASVSRNSNNNNFRDAREIINERRMHNQQQNFHAQKVQSSPSTTSEHQQQLQQRHLQLQHHQHQQHQHHQQLAMQQHQHMVQHQLLHHHHQADHHLRLQHQQQQPPPQQQTVQNQTQQQVPQQGQASQPAQPTQQPQQQLQSQQPIQNPRQQQQQQASQAQQQPRQAVGNSLAGDNPQESGRLGASNSTNNNDLINSRPIIKTDTFTSAGGGHSQQQQQPTIQQHSHNGRTIGGPMSQQQQGPGSSAATHMVPSHMGATGAQYYSPTNNSRDSATAAALASAYHGYIPGGHSVIDTGRYHMTSQQMSDHGYMAPAGQGNDVAAASVMHQQGMYSDSASSGGTVASSAYLAQAGSTLSPSTNIPVTGAGPPPLAPVSYLQHSQYAPPPYTDPYSQPQHNQAPPPPPQSSHAYPYWTYI